MARAYRSWATRHPGRYESTLVAPSPDDPEDVAASDVLVRLAFDVLAAYALEGDDATRMLRAQLHGFVALEAAGGFRLPADVDRSFARLVAGLTLALSEWPSVVEGGARQASAPAAAAPRSR